MVQSHVDGIIRWPVCPVGKLQGVQQGVHDVLKVLIPVSQRTSWCSAGLSTLVPGRWLKGCFWSFQRSSSKGPSMVAAMARASGVDAVMVLCQPYIVARVNAPVVAIFSAKTMPPSRVGRVALSSMISILTSAYIIADEPAEAEISIGVVLMTSWCCADHI